MMDVADMGGKVALYTIFRCTNYGAVLQAHALARILRNILGEDGLDVINHRMDPRDNHLLGKITNPNTPWFQRWRNRRKFAAKYHAPHLFEIRRAKTVRLIETEIRPTRRLYMSPSEFGTLPPYKTVVVGSDQIWNPGLNHDFGCNQYLCRHLRKEQDRVAYAASFGVSELPPASLTEYRDALSCFRKITVREEAGAQICGRLFAAGDGAQRGLSAPEVVLDPTLLLSAEDWLSAVVNQDGETPPSAGIVAYWVRTVTQADVDALAGIARKMGCRVCLLSAGPLPKLDFGKSIFPYVDATPFDFVRTISNSERIITDSFHGTVFATLFGRSFAALGDVSNPKSNASRFVDFCNRYGLSREIGDISAFRSGVDVTFADAADFCADSFAADRRRSIAALESMVG